MNFSPEETESLRKQLLVVLEPFTEADPDALLDFILLFINKGSSRDELMETYKNELEVFCEENTTKAVEAVFKVIDEIIAAREPTTTTSTEPIPPPAATAGQKREKEESEDEDDDDDDDRNFKRRNMNAEDDVRDVPPATVATPIANASSPSTKRKTPEDVSQNDTSERPSKVSRSPEQEKVFASLPEHLRKRLGNRDGPSSNMPQEPQPRARLPCRHFEEHGYCLYGDNCKFDHGQNVAVTDYSNFQAMFSTPGSAAMSNPMMMNMAGQITPFNMTTSPYGFQNPINIADQQSSSQILPPQQQQPQQWKSHQQKLQQQQFNNSNNNKSTLNNNNNRSYQQTHEVPYTTRYTKTSTRLVIEKIPIEQCTIDSVTETFKKFGTIVDIELQPENQRAFLEFKTHEEALEAHQSPEVIFNNRFVKVYWRKESVQKQQEQAYQQQSTEPDPELVKKRAAEFAKMREEQQRRKKEQLEKQIEYNKKKQEIARRNLELAMLKAKVAEMEAKKQGAAAVKNQDKDATEKK